MKKRSTLRSLCITACMMLLALSGYAQCSLSVSTVVNDSRCKATGSIQINVTGGSGDYNYKLTGGPSPIVTSSNLITALPPGTYTVDVKDVSSGCTAEITGVVVGGSYQDPRFALTGTDVTCINGSNGTLSVINQQYGLAPFHYTIVSPSASSVGNNNSTGSFNGLVSGDYYVQLTDSCGGIQTRIYTISNYNWWIDSKSVSKAGCDSVDVTVTVKDNKGNVNSSGSNFSGFMYGYSLVPGDTSWFSTRSFRFFLNHARSVQLITKDACGNVKSSSWTDAQPNVGSSVSISNKQCADFTATVTGQQNLTSPTYCLYDNSNTLVSCNSTGVFSNVPYGSYCIHIQDNCFDTLITRCFSVSQPAPSVSASVSISSKACSTFTATVTGQTNLNSPQYCIYDSANNLITCNSTGVFPGLAYGSYCIHITDGCTGTVITRCFTQRAPVPTVAGSVSIGSQDCTSFTASITGQGNLNSPQYCLYDSAGTLVTCNSTGVFSGLQYGSYCIHIQNNTACYDTTIMRCFTVTKPVPSVGSSVSISNKACSDFTATVTGQSNLTNPQYCLYDNNNNVLTCNSTGVFTNVPYGSYCIHITNDSTCFDTVITRCFTVSKPFPSVSASVSISNKTCSGFQAKITGQSNLNNAQYCLYDNSHTLVTCNNTGTFPGIPYGSYSIEITNDSGCYDTVIVRNFSQSAAPLNPSVNATPSCTIGTTDLSISWTGTGSPYQVTVYNPGGMVVGSYSGSSNSTSITGLTGLPAGYQYKVLVTDNCGGSDSTLVTPHASSVTKSINANSKCPGGQWPDGSGDLIVNAQYSEGWIKPQIIKKDGVATTINYSSSSGSNFTFANMAPAQYIIQYSLQNCSTKLYDTFNLAPYAFPNLAQSAVYQCNNNSFSVSAAVTGGLSPFSYEIIGSLPDTPSIVSSSQAAPVFSINNGVTYNLVRLRALDACGNATINDASVLPLGNTSISASSDCFYNNITLSVDTIPNASYSWYRMTSPTDSVLLGSGQDYNISYLLPSDTGTYVSKVSVNSGCLTQVTYFNVTGTCGSSLLAANQLSFSGVWKDQAALLSWTTGADFGADQFIVEHSIDGKSFDPIGTVKAGASHTGARHQYQFSDHHAADGINYYRLRMKSGEKISFSQVVTVTGPGRASIQAIPNPVDSYFEVRFRQITPGFYQLRLLGVDGREWLREGLELRADDLRRFQRPANLRPGVYFLQVTRQDGRDKGIIKLLFR